MKKDTIILKNEKSQTLKELFDGIFNEKEIRCIEVYSKKDDSLFVINLEDGVVTEDTMSEFYLLMVQHSEYILDKYAITGCNFQAIIN